MRRREVIVAVGGAALALPLLARAQTAGVKRIGIIYHGGAYTNGLHF